MHTVINSQDFLFTPSAAYKRAAQGTQQPATASKSQVAGGSLTLKNSLTRSRTHDSITNKSSVVRKSWKKKQEKESAKLPETTSKLEASKLEASKPENSKPGNSSKLENLANSIANSKIFSRRKSVDKSKITAETENSLKQVFSKPTKNDYKDDFEDLTDSLSDISSYHSSQDSSSADEISTDEEAVSRAQTAAGGYQVFKNEVSDTQVLKHSARVDEISLKSSLDSPKSSSKSKISPQPKTSLKISPQTKNTAEIPGPCGETPKKPQNPKHSNKPSSTDIKTTDIKTDSNLAKISIQTTNTSRTVKNTSKNLNTSNTSNTPSPKPIPRKLKNIRSRSLPENEDNMRRYHNFKFQIISNQLGPSNYSRMGASGFQFWHDDEVLPMPPADVTLSGAWHLKGTTANVLNDGNGDLSFLPMKRNIPPELCFKVNMVKPVTRIVVGNLKVSFQIFW